MTDTKISVIISIYNGEKDLHIMLDSLKAQKFEDIEYILIDNGSSDNTHKICESYAAEDSRFRVETIKENIGYIMARNHGISLAKGEFITFADADDFISQDAYQIMYDAVSKSNSDLCVAPYNKIYNDEKSIFIPLNIPAGTYAGEKMFNYITLAIFGNNVDNVKINGFTWRMLIRKSVVDKTNNLFFVEAKPKEDELFNQLHIINSNSVEIIDFPVYNYRINNNSVTAKLTSNFDYKATWQNDVFFMDKSFENAEKSGNKDKIQNTLYINLYRDVYELIINTAKSNSFGSLSAIAKDFKLMLDTERILNMTEYYLSTDCLNKVDKFVFGCLKNKKYKKLLLTVKLMQKAKK